MPLCRLFYNPQLHLNNKSCFLSKPVVYLCSDVLKILMSGQSHVDVLGTFTEIALAVDG